MRVIIPGLCAVCAVVALVCRSGMAGEGYVSADPIGMIWRTLLESGITGCFIAYLIWREIQDRKQKIKENERWHTLDRELVDLVEKYSRFTTESIGVLNSLRDNIQQNTLELRRLAEGACGTGVRRRGETRIFGDE